MVEIHSHLSFLLLTQNPTDQIAWTKPPHSRLMTSRAHPTCDAQLSLSPMPSLSQDRSCTSPLLCHTDTTPGRQEKNPGHCLTPEVEPS